MTTHLPQNQFITNSAPARTSPDADAADVSCAPPLTGASADLSTNPIMPTVGSVVPSDLPPVIGGTAALNSALASAMTADTDAAPDLTDPPVAASVLIAEPTSSTGGPQEAPAPRCTEPHDGAGALADRIDWHEFFEAVMDERIILFELTNDVPLFIRDGNHLRRWEA